MNLEEKINFDIKESILKKQTSVLESLRLIKSAIQNEKSKDGREFLNDDEVIKIIQKLVNKSIDSELQYKEGNRLDLANHERVQISVYQLYLPKQLSVAEIEEKIKEIIIQTGATTIRDMGKVMSEATQFFAGSADNKTIGLIVKKMLL